MALNCDTIEMRRTFAMVDFSIKKGDDKKLGCSKIFRRFERVSIHTVHFSCKILKTTAVLSGSSIAHALFLKKKKTEGVHRLREQRQPRFYYDKF